MQTLSIAQKFVRSTAVVVALMAACFAGTAPAAPADPSVAPPASATTQTPYILGPQDVVEIEVLGQSDFKVRAPIGSDGTIKLPYIGSVTASGKTSDQLSADISQALVAGGYFAHPILSVEIVGFASRYVTVLGDVGSPGLVPIDRPYHLSEILARVGGVRADAADYVILRPQDGPEHQYLVSALITGDESQDPMVAPGDRIFSPTAQLFYISGEVKTPGAFPITTGMTLRMAIGRGGGLTDIGTDHGVKVTHSDGKIDHPGLDDKIGPGDVIVVGERLF
jgi:polysaccharide biosynthesis/export protein